MTTEERSSRTLKGIRDFYHYHPNLSGIASIVLLTWLTYKLGFGVIVIFIALFFLSEFETHK